MLGCVAVEPGCTIATMSPSPGPSPSLSLSLSLSLLVASSMEDGPGESPVDTDDRALSSRSPVYFRPLSSRST